MGIQHHLDGKPPTYTGLTQAIRPVHCPQILQRRGSQHLGDSRQRPQGAGTLRARRLSFNVGRHRLRARVGVERHHAPLFREDGGPTRGPGRRVRRARANQERYC